MKKPISEMTGPACSAAVPEEEQVGDSGWRGVRIQRAGRIDLGGRAREVRQVREERAHGSIGNSAVTRR